MSDILTLKQGEAELITENLVDTINRERATLRQARTPKDIYTSLTKIHAAAEHLLQIDTTQAMLITEAVKSDLQAMLIGLRRKNARNTESTNPDEAVRLAALVEHLTMILNAEQTASGLVVATKPQTIAHTTALRN
ncbi:MAG TPA: hypothetical protein PKL83_02495 [bacterium]|nr:hypothetical protein [bacterium]